MKNKPGNDDKIQEYLASRLDNFEKKLGDFKTEIRSDFIDFEERIDRKVTEAITNTLDKLYTRIDPLLREIENNREDREITTEKLSNHERRIKKLENN